MAASTGISVGQIRGIEHYYNDSIFPKNRQKIEEGANTEDLPGIQPKLFLHLKLAFEALDRLFALKTKDDIYEINSVTRTDGAQTNAEAYLGDAFRNLFLAKHYILEEGDGKSFPEVLKKQDFTFRIDNLRNRVKQDLSAQQQSHYDQYPGLHRSRRLGQVFDLRSSVTRLPFEPDDVRTNYDLFNRVLKDNRTDLFGKKGFTAKAIGDYLITEPSQHDWLMFYGYPGKELDLRPLGEFTPQALMQIPDLLAQQVDMMPHLEKIHFADADKGKLLQMQLDPRVKALIE